MRVSDGLVLESQRSLNPLELAELRNLARSTRIKSILSGLSIPVTFLLLLVFMAETYDREIGIAFILPMLAALLLLGYCSVRWVDLRRRSKVLGLTLRDPVVELFVPSAEPLFRETTRHLHEDDDDEEKADPQPFERFRTSGFVWSLDGQRPSKFLVVPATDLASSPEVPPSRYQVVGEGFDVQSVPVRRLTSEEQAEILRIIKSRFLRATAFNVFMALFAAAQASNGWIAVRNENPAGWALFLICGFLALLFIYVLLLKLSQRGLLKKDLGAGEVYEYVIAGVRTEVLPQSCLIWTEDGLPAPWRHQTAGEAARY